jgi:hypothetical protein
MLWRLTLTHKDIVKHIGETKAAILLEGVICHGTLVFGRYDQCCHLFWREEWLGNVGP